MWKIMKEYLAGSVLNIINYPDPFVFNLSRMFNGFMCFFGFIRFNASRNIAKIF